MKKHLRRRRRWRKPVPDVPSKFGLLLLPRLETFEMKLESRPITGTPRKLRVRWTLDDPAHPPTEIIHEHGVTYRIWH